MENVPSFLNLQYNQKPVQTNDQKVTQNSGNTEQVTANQVIGMGNAPLGSQGESPEYDPGALNLIGSE